jgi:hypothetical protein
MLPLLLRGALVMRMLLLVLDLCQLPPSSR